MLNQSLECPIIVFNFCRRWFMSEEKGYENLIDHIRDFLFGLPESDLLMPIIKLRFSKEEAEFLSKFPYIPHTIEQLSDRYGISTTRLEDKMRPMIKKGMIYEVEGKSAVRYSFTDAVFFLLRMPGWQGKRDRLNERISPLLNRYYFNDMGADFMGYPTKGLRAIPIARTIADPRKIRPYEDVLEFVDKEKDFAVTHCACRHRHNIDPDFLSCRHETLNCLHFGILAKYIIKHDMGKEVTKAEVFDILAAAAEAGLVHGISNTTSGMDTICNCCKCCCVFLEAIRMPAPVPRGHEPSNYMIKINHETCKACGLCVERCPMGALTFKEEGEKPKEKTLSYDLNLCLGCGVCVHKCPTQSLSLVQREIQRDYPTSHADAGRRILTERNRNFSRLG
jgi:ferredoxin